MNADRDEPRHPFLLNCGTTQTAQRISSSRSLCGSCRKYQWCAGVDIDLEHGVKYENRAEENALFRDIYSTVKNYSPAKLVNNCQAGMMGVQGSVGGENWCVHADSDAYCDTASIIGYGVAWASSTPGPVSLRGWLEGIYNYASKAIHPEKIFM